MNELPFKMNSTKLRKIISGAQTGADQAGLVAAEKLGLEVGGTVLKGRRTNIGPLTDGQMKRWNLVEHSSPNYPPRTACNVKDSDGTVIFGNVHSPGSQLTIRLCSRHNKPIIWNPPTHQTLRDFVESNQIKVLNVAGNREETNPGIFLTVFNFLIKSFYDTIKCEECGKPERIQYCTPVEQYLCIDCYRKTSKNLKGLIG